MNTSRKYVTSADEARPVRVLEQVGSHLYRYGASYRLDVPHGPNDYRNYTHVGYVNGTTKPLER